MSSQVAGLLGALGFVITNIVGFHIAKRSEAKLLRALIRVGFLVASVLVALLLPGLAEDPISASSDAGSRIPLLLIAVFLLRRQLGLRPDYGDASFLGQLGAIAGGLLILGTIAQAFLGGGSSGERGAASAGGTGRRGAARGNQSHPRNVGRHRPGQCRPARARARHRLHRDRLRADRHLGAGRRALGRPDGRPRARPRSGTAYLAGDGIGLRSVRGVDRDRGRRDGGAHGPSRPRGVTVSFHTASTIFAARAESRE